MSIKPVDPTSSNLAWQLWLDGASDLVKLWDMQPSSAGRAQYENQRYAIQRFQTFYGCSGEAEARETLLKGYPEGAAIVEALAKKIEEELPPPKSRRRMRRWGDDGDEASFERYQAGLDPWLTSHRVLRSSCGLVEVIANWGQDCGATLSQLKWSGSAALALTELLEKADYSVELALVAIMRDETWQQRDSFVRVDLKRMGELLNLEQLAAVAVYPPAWRIYGLCAFQQSPYECGRGYDSHPHSGTYHHQPNGMWNYRPNVMTLVLNPSADEASARQAVLEGLKTLDSLVNPQDAQQEEIQP